MAAAARTSHTARGRRREVTWLERAGRRGHVGGPRRLCGPARPLRLAVAALGLGGAAGPGGVMRDYGLEGLGGPCRACVNVCVVGGRLPRVAGASGLGDVAL